MAVYKEGDWGVDNFGLIGTGGVYEVATAHCQGSITGSGGDTGQLGRITNKVTSDTTLVTAETEGRASVYRIWYSWQW